MEVIEEINGQQRDKSGRAILSGFTMESFDKYTYLLIPLIHGYWRYSNKKPRM
jgi:hypothetical protein